MKQPAKNTALDTRSGRRCTVLRPAARCAGGVAMAAAVNEYVTQIGARPSTARCRAL